MISGTKPKDIASIFFDRLFSLAQKEGVSIDEYHNTHWSEKAIHVFREVLYSSRLFLTEEVCEWMGLTANQLKCRIDYSVNLEAVA